MNADMATDLVRQALYVSLQISAPLLLVAMIIGLGISVFQSVTQINELTLTFVPKMLVFGVLLGVLFPWIVKTMLAYTNNILLYQWEKLISLTQYTQ